MIQHIINQYGQYIQTLSGTAEEILSKIPVGCDAVNLPPSRSTDYWNGTNWVNIGAPPAHYFEFDYEIKQWIDKRNLDAVKKQKWEEIKLLRNKDEFGGVVINGIPYDTDLISQNRLLAAFVFGQPVSWTTADDKVVELTAEEIREVGIKVAAHVQQAHERGRIARNAILSSESLNEVDAVLY